MKQYLRFHIEQKEKSLKTEKIFNNLNKNQQKFQTKQF